jgi:hypothetical protein
MNKLGDNFEVGNSERRLSVINKIDLLSNSKDSQNNQGLVYISLKTGEGLIISQLHVLFAGIF